jgi:hypothetical protein
MSRRWLIGIITVAAVVLTCGVASAKNGMGGGNGSSSQFDGGIFLYQREAPSPPDGGKNGIVGLGYEMTGRWAGSPHWRWNASFGYGLGDWKAEATTGGVSSTQEFSYTSWEVRLGWDYWSDCCDQQWYCGPGFAYMSTKATEKETGAADFDIEPMKVYGFEPRVGGQMKVGTKMSVFGGTSMLIGYGSYDQTVGGDELKVTGWFTALSWRTGLRWTY